MKTIKISDLTMPDHPPMPFPKEETPPEPPKPESFEWYDTVRVMLAPYEPAASKREADVFYSTMEIVGEVEAHEGCSIAYSDMALVLRSLGYSECNTGGLQLEWMLKRKD